jgi:hypothetical protein
MFMVLVFMLVFRSNNLSCNNLSRPMGERILFEALFLSGKCEKLELQKEVTFESYHHIVGLCFYKHMKSLMTLNE